MIAGRNGVSIFWRRETAAAIVASQVRRRRIDFVTFGDVDVIDFVAHCCIMYVVAKELRVNFRSLRETSQVLERAWQKVRHEY
jgi:hypothetical protein